MLASTPLTGADLPLKTVSLTFDDGPGSTAGTGPGPRTFELAEFLFQQNIRATFFVVGKHVAGHEAALRKMTSMGHLIANHTVHHPLLRGAGAALAIREILECDRVLAGLTLSQPKLFRAPYGFWDGADKSYLDQVNSTDARQFIGPVHWDVDGGDWYFWQNGFPVDACLANYMQLIKKAGRGIVLLHDSSADSELIRARQRTFELTRLLVARLQQDGFHFVRLDEVPQVQAAIRDSLACASDEWDYPSSAAGRPSLQ